jgi:hypothetical protein
MTSRVIGDRFSGVLAGSGTYALDSGLGSGSTSISIACEDITAGERCCVKPTARARMCR